jgi:hypothetical protein
MTPRRPPNGISFGYQMSTLSEWHAGMCPQIKTLKRYGGRVTIRGKVTEYQISHPAKLWELASGTIAKGDAHARAFAAIKGGFTDFHKATEAAVAAIHKAEDRG